MNTIGDRIRIRREQLGLSQEELARRIGYKSRSSINKIELNVQQLTQRKIKAIADALGVSPTYILGIEGDPPEESVTIPIYGRVAAGIPVEAIENIVDYEEIPAHWAGEYGGLVVAGDSMAPRILDGDYLIVRRQDDADSGDVVVAFVNGQDATCKKLIKHKNGITLQPFNPAYEPMFFTNEEIARLPVRIWGKVVENRAHF